MYFETLQEQEGKWKPLPKVELSSGGQRVPQGRFKIPKPDRGGWVVLHCGWAYMAPPLNWC